MSSHPKTTCWGGMLLRETREPPLTRRGSSSDCRRKGILSGLQHEERKNRHAPKKLTTGFGHPILGSQVYVCTRGIRCPPTVIGPAALCQERSFTCGIDARSKHGDQFWAGSQPGPSYGSGRKSAASGDGRRASACDLQRQKGNLPRGHSTAYSVGGLPGKLSLGLTGHSSLDQGHLQREVERNYTSQHQQSCGSKPCVYKRRISAVTRSQLPLPLFPTLLHTWKLFPLRFPFLHLHSFVYHAFTRQG